MRIQVYAALNKVVMESSSAIDGKEPEDVKKAIELMRDAVKGYGPTYSRTMPFGHPLGADDPNGVREQCESMSK